jgi:uncharacterized membrane protein YphA (DoxX/SURF4 family)
MFLLGRLMFGGYFLYNAFNHFKNRKALAQYAASKQAPLPEVAVIASGVALAVGGASILLGLKPKVGATALMAFLGTVSPVMHNFWAAEDPNQRQADMINFTKNMALLGAALALFGLEEPWPASVDRQKATPLDRLKSAARALAV